MPELTAALDWLPIASLLLAEDGSALDVNEAWTELSGVQAEDSLRYGWLDAVEPLDRARLRVRLREAAASGRAGSADVQLEHGVTGRLSRWWWRPGPAGRLVMCVARLGDDVPRSDGEQLRLSAASQAEAMLGSSARLAKSERLPDGRRSDEPSLPPDASAELAQLIVQRLFRVGLVLESAIGVSDGRGLHWLQEAVDELDLLIRDVRAMVFARPAGRRLDVP